MMNVPIRVLVVDDSALMRRLVTDMLAKDPDLEVVGQARDGQDALDRIPLLRPDVITLDVEMPILDGVQTLQAINASDRTPVVMLSSKTQAGTETTLQCLQLGAVDFVAKPSGAISLDVQKVEVELIEKVKLAAKTRKSPIPPTCEPTSQAASTIHRRIRPTVICIGSSTGGPKALNELIPKLPKSLDVAIVIVQHLPRSFTEMLASRLNQDCEFEVREAREGDRLQPGVVLVAPGGCHLEFDSNGIAHLTEAPPVHGVRPAVDVTMGSLVRTFGSRMIGVLLTGMGRDGALAMKSVREAGGLTIGEDESTCVVFGMPKAAFDGGGVERLIPLPNIAAELIQVVGEAAKGSGLGVAV